MAVVLREAQLELSFDEKRRIEARPIVKWAGGKWQLLPVFSLYFPSPSQIDRYFEPFLGGAAVFFHLQPPRSFLSDSNAELIEVYQVVQSQVEALLLSLRQHRNERDYYYRLRAIDPETLTPVERASRLIYLNRTCYNGLYRVNSAGKFNVPFGRYANPRICDEEGLRAASLALQGARLFVADFEDALADARSGDFVYFDPPYYPLSKTSSFTSYTRDRFDEKEQRRLASVYRDLDRRGCYLMLSNSSAPLIYDLYKGFRVVKVEASRAISCKGDGRGPVTELLILNYP